MITRLDRCLSRLDASWVFPAILIAGVVVRVIAAFALRNSPLVSDAGRYHQAALQLLEGTSFTPFLGPGVSLFLLPFYRVFGATEMVARFTMILFHVGFAIVLYLLLARIASRRTANLFNLLFAAYPSFIYHAVTPVSHLPACFCLLSIVYLGLRWARLPGRAAQGRGILISLGTGLLLGMLALTRPNGIAFVIAAPLVLAIARRSILGLVLPLLPAIALILAWNAKASAMSSQPVFINTAHAMNLFLGNNPYTPLYRTWWFSAHHGAELPPAYREIEDRLLTLTSVQRDEEMRRIAREHILERPDLFVLRTMSRFRCFLAFDTYTGGFLIKAYRWPKWSGLLVVAMDNAVYLPIMCLFLVYWFTPWPRAECRTMFWVSMAPMALYALPHWLTFSHPTYHLPIVPLGAIPAAALLERAARESIPGLWMTIRSSRWRWIGLAVSLLLFAYIQLEWALVMGRQL